MSINSLGNNSNGGYEEGTIRASQEWAALNGIPFAGSANTRPRAGMPTAEQVMLEDAARQQAPAANFYAPSPTGIPSEENKLFVSAPESIVHNDRPMTSIENLRLESPTPDSVIHYDNPMTSVENQMLESPTNDSVVHYDRPMTSVENLLLETSEAEQQYNLQKHAEERQTARETVGSILNNDERMLENVKKIAFDDNIRSEFLRDYKDAAYQMVKDNINDYSDEASKRVNKFVEDYCNVIYTMDNVNRETGNRLVDVASNAYDINGEDGGLRLLSEFLQKRRKNGCDVNIAVPINYSENDPHPKMDGVLVANWLDQRINQQDLNTTASTNNLKEQINTKKSGKSAYQRYLERMAARNK